MNHLRRPGFPGALLALCAALLACSGCYQIERKTPDFFYSPVPKVGLNPDQLAAQEQAAGHGEQAAMKALYRQYTRITPDKAKARCWLKKLANLGDPAAQLRWGLGQLDTGRRIVGLQWIRKAARQNYLPAVRFLESPGFDKLPFFLDLHPYDEAVARPLH